MNEIEQKISEMEDALGRLSKHHFDRKQFDVPDGFTAPTPPAPEPPASDAPEPTSDAVEE